MSNNPPEEAITYITMLSAFQVILNCQSELEGSNYYQGKSKEVINTAINTLSLNNAKNRNKIWKIDEKLAADIMHSIHVIGEQIAQSNPLGLHAITYLTRQGIDLSKIKIVELTDEELKKPLN